jgi:addiction module HigA family antidote
MKKTSADNLIAGDLFVPGTYIQEEMEARGMKQVELAEKLGLSKSEMSLIIHGKRSITVPIAIKLEKIFKIDAEIWMNIQIKYEIEKLKRQYSKELKDKSISAKKKIKIKRAISAA